ncbi:hypothetical protein N474_17035 [Pseudoalteromonas luteoviolacea CPMOR-2]|uniref:Uncharacterized protein n=1 Tax=Pseudoalteromonas luteoviolacea DSM 6061 TaxID=1365250 RepID=A0A166VR67_9GAMM|nr:hypothetical protein [Pseudoalteromonas luteoviolacea]KZN33349.1 hypothetical protein N475_20315 [Pseudoalteromonas luteoviolacea DSM 6061]KZN54906.1 hypothetical protein N474_17035 [Pseudoalteromonas luteoviolacea CPMOR-2]MBE0387248.1 hypothetical protein [Pseudoalteromonas luteoviolacea DSM 6061]
MKINKTKLKNLSTKKQLEHKLTPNVQGGAISVLYGPCLSAPEFCGTLSKLTYC